MRTHDYPPSIEQLLLTKGSAIPPLRWHVCPNRTLLQLLLSKSTTDLFAPDEVINREIGRCVVAGLALWCGFPAVVRKLCRSMKNSEAIYWQAIACRQADQYAISQRLLDAIGDHSIYSELGERTLQAIGMGTENHLHQFSDALGDAKTWAPAAFLDLFRLSRDGDLPSASINIVCEIQQMEFELLLTHCYFVSVGKAPVAQNHL